jgi:hypothetical protein
VVLLNHYSCYSDTRGVTLTIANMSAPAKEATLETGESKKDKKLSHSDRPGTSKSNDKRRNSDRSMDNVEWSRHNRTEYQPSEYEGFLDGICIFHHQGKHETRDCNKLHGFVDEVLKSAKNVEQEKKAEDPKHDFREARKEINYIYIGPDSSESKSKQKLPAQEVMSVGPATPEYLKCSEAPITFDHSDT